MKKHRAKIGVIIILIISIISIVIWNNEKAIVFEETLIINDTITEKISVINAVNLINQDTSIKFPFKFKKGHAKIKAFKDYYEKTDYGYNLTTKSETNIPTPLIVGDRIFLSGGFRSKEYFCFNKKSGKNIWAVDLDDDGPSTAIYSDSLIYFNTESCTIFALDYLSGNLKWAYWLGDPLLTTPSIVKGTAITTYPHIPKIDSTKLDSLLIRPSHPIIGLNKKTGKISWQRWLDGDIISQAVPNDSVILVTTFPGTLYKIDAEDGNIMASIKLGATSIPTVKENLIYIPKRSDDSTTIKESIAILDFESLGFIREFNVTNAPYLDFEIQKNTLLKKQADSLDIGNGFFFTPQTSGWELASKNIGQSNVSSLQMFQGSQIKFVEDTLITLKGNILYSINRKSEEIIWTDTLKNDYLSKGGFAATPVELFGNQIIILTTEGELRLYDIENGNLNHKLNIGESVRSKPLINEKWIYIPTMNGKLICIDLQKIKKKTG